MKKYIHNWIKRKYIGRETKINLSPADETNITIFIYIQKRDKNFQQLVTIQIEFPKRRTFFLFSKYSFGKSPFLLDVRKK